MSDKAAEAEVGTGVDGEPKTVVNHGVMVNIRGMEDTMHLRGDYTTDIKKGNIQTIFLEPGDVVLVSFSEDGKTVTVEGG